MAFGKTVTVRPTGSDEFGRTLASGILADGLNLKQSNVQHG